MFTSAAKKKHGQMTIVRLLQYQIFDSKLVYFLKIDNPSAVKHKINKKRCGFERNVRYVQFETYLGRPALKKIRNFVECVGVSTI